MKKMTPVKWLIVALAILGLGGLIYWLLQPKTAAAAVGTPGTAVGFLGGLFRPATSTTTTTYVTTPGMNLGGEMGTMPGTYIPPTPAVDATDQGGGNYTSNPAWQFGDYGAIDGNDFEGRPFVRTSAPTIPFEVKNRPYTYGINYPFEDQTAKGIANVRRFPEFSLPANKIHAMGPWYSNGYANDSLFTRGITSITALPNFRLGGSQSVDQLPRFMKNDMVGDPVFHAIARELYSQSPTDYRADAWRRFGHEAHFTLDEAAFIEIGRSFWAQERAVTATDYQGVMYLCVDLESTSPFDYIRQGVGWIYQGACTAAAEEGLTVIPYLYSTNTQTTGVLGFSERVNGFLDPQYLLDEFDFLAGGDPLLTAIRQFNGVVTVDTYIQAIWGYEDMQSRDENGRPYLDGEGKPVFSQLGSTTVYGQLVSLESGEARRAVQDLYEQSTRLYLMQHRLAGQYPAIGGQRRESMIGVQAGSFTRNTQEGVDGIVQNDRPVPAWQMDMFNSLNLFLSNHIWCWSVDFNQPPAEVGSDHSSVWAYQAHGTIESMIRAAHRASAFAQIQTSAFKWCWFNLAMVNNMRGDGNSYGQKSLLHAKIRNVNGAAWLEFWAAFPCSDSYATKYLVWVEFNGIQSEAYECMIQNGRQYFFDAWQLASVFSYDQLEGANIYVSYVDTNGDQRIYRGDYRLEVGNVSIPGSQAGPGYQEVQV